MRIINIFFLSCLFVLSNKAFAAEAASSALKVGFIDSSRILQEYPAAQQLLNDLAKSEAALNKKILDRKEKLLQAKSQNKTETELQMLAEQMKNEIEPEAKKLEADSAARSAVIEKKVDEIIQQVAKQGKYNVVLAKEAVLFGGTNLTDEVLKKLK